MMHDPAHPFVYVILIPRLSTSLSTSASNIDVRSPTHQSITVFHSLERSGVPTLELGDQELFLPTTDHPYTPLCPFPLLISVYGSPSSFNFYLTRL